VDDCPSIRAQFIEDDASALIRYQYPQLQYAFYEIVIPHAVRKDESVRGRARQKCLI
jgi:hypothetical protein